VSGYVSAVDDLVLHGCRVLGFASVDRVAARYGLDPDEVEDVLLAHGTRGWVGHARFADAGGWHLTEAGRVEGERRLAAELAAAGALGAVTTAHQRFLPLNRRFARACTNWQVRPMAGDPSAANDHDDWGWDDRVLRTLDAVGRALPEVTTPLASALRRFEGYDDRFAAALARVNAAQPQWIDAPDVDSCHTVWVQLHEDLLATLGIPRGADG
jgi:hypothetical protein